MLYINHHWGLPQNAMNHKTVESIFFSMCLKNTKEKKKLTTGMTLAAMSGKRTLQEWRVRTNSCLYLSVSSCSVTLFVLITSFFRTITNYKTNRCHYICSIFPLFSISMHRHKNNNIVDLQWMLLTSSTLRDETRSSASCKVFFLTSRSGVLRTRRMSMTRS